MVASVTEKKILRFGHTPDPDDAYMFYGLATKQVEIPGFEIEHILEDIEQLNQKALLEEIEVTAISTAVYPALQNKYWILPTGASVGRNYGPIVVKKSGSFPEGKKIGIPGKNTTAFLLLKLYAPGYEPVELRFDEIPQALESGRVDYGLLIHEVQLTYEKFGFEKLLDLGEAWMKDTGLPIPLGLDVVRKDLGKENALNIWRALKKSIEIANEQKDQAIAHSLNYGRGLEPELGHQFVGMYVNEDTLEIGEEGEKALNLLFDKSYRAGLIKKPVIVDILRP